MYVIIQIIYNIYYYIISDFSCNIFFQSTKYNVTKYELYIQIDRNDHRIIANLPINFMCNCIGFAYNIYASRKYFVYQTFSNIFVLGRSCQTPPSEAIEFHRVDMYMEIYYTYTSSDFRRNKIRA